MKQAVLLHGTDGNNIDYFWFADTKHYLEDHGYQVWWPQLPHTSRPTIEESSLFVEEHMPPIDEQSIIVGHSSACPLILHILDMSLIKIRQVILVAGFYASIKDNDLSLLMMPQEGFDYERIVSAAEEIILINSDNDPWGCDDIQARPVAEALNAKFVLAKGQGHMGSSAFDQPYCEFPLLNNLIKLSNE